LCVYNRRIIYGGLIALLALVAKSFVNSGALQPIISTSGHNCSLVGDFPGPEDLTLLKSGSLLVSWADRRHPNMPGGLSTVALDDGSNFHVSSVTLIGFPDDRLPLFSPHGISLFVNAFSEFSFVINHNGKRYHTIEVFEVVTDEMFRYLRTVRDPGLLSPNDLWALSPTQFYWTNDHFSSNHFAQIVTDLLGVPTGSVYYFNGQKGVPVATRLSFANGIAVSNGLLHVAEATGRRMTSYTMQASGEISPTSVAVFDRAPDNIEIDENGTLWLACHANTILFLGHASNPSVLSPSQVITVQFSAHGSETVEVLMNDGSIISAASTARPWKDFLIVGQVFERGIIACRKR